MIPSSAGFVDLMATPSVQIPSTIPPSQSPIVEQSRTEIIYLVSTPPCVVKCAKRVRASFCDVNCVYDSFYISVNGNWRYLRSCAWLGEPGVGRDERYCIHRSGTYNIHVEYCTCRSKDGCNAGETFKPHAFMLLLLPLTCVSVATSILLPLGIS